MLCTHIWIPGIKAQGFSRQFFIIVLSCPGNWKMVLSTAPGSRMPVRVIETTNEEIFTCVSRDWKYDIS